jgi:hypothetical protein
MTLAEALVNISLLASGISLLGLISYVSKLAARIDALEKHDEPKSS